jgi:hypothetical protein
MIIEPSTAIHIFLLLIICCVAIINIFTKDNYLFLFIISILMIIVIIYTLIIFDPNLTDSILNYSNQ